MERSVRARTPCGKRAGVLRQWMKPKSISYNKEDLLFSSVVIMTKVIRDQRFFTQGMVMLIAYFADKTRASGALKLILAYRI